jgi:hypothetical protein
MALKKAIAGYFDENKNWIPQQDVDMHPLEEAEIRASWTVGDSQGKMPIKPTNEQEHDWLIEHGAQFVKQKREEWKAAHAEWLKGHEPLVAEHRRHANAYEAHFNSLDKK